MTGMLLRILTKLRLLIWRGHFHRELGEEMAFHREQVEEEFRAEGMSAEQAHRAAARPARQPLPRPHRARLALERTKGAVDTAPFATYLAGLTAVG